MAPLSSAAPRRSRSSQPSSRATRRSTLLTSAAKVSRRRPTSSIRGTQRAPQQAANRHNRAECQPILPKVPGWRLRLRAPRPRFCALSNRRLEAAGIEMPHWRDAVARYARWAHSRFPGAVCRQRWTVRLGEVEPVFGQTGRVVLDITARTAHDGAFEMDKSAIDTPSREIDLRNIPVHLRTALPAGAGV